MIDEFNTVEIKKFNSGCRCKVCDDYASEGIYLKSFRLSAQAFHICFECWEEINKTVERYRFENIIN